MARRKTSTFEDLMEAVSKLHWWVGTLLALVSYLGLHAIASRPVTITITSPGQMGNAVVKGLISSLAMFGQYVLPFAFSMGAMVSAINSIKNKKLYNRVESRSDVAALNEMSWGDFEHLVGEYFRRSGFQVTQEGGNGPDGGMDLLLRKNSETHLVQCKQWKAYKVGVQPVREFYGVMSSRGAAGGYFVTSGAYTEEAREFVRGLNVELIDGTRLREMIDMARKQSEASITNNESPQAVVDPVLQQDRHESTTCPKCGGQLIERVAKKGSFSGKSFLGCSNYPRCKYIRKN